MDREKLQEQLRLHEGQRLMPYTCPAGRLTIGIGRNIQDKGITEAEALYLLNNDIDECLADCRRIFPNFDELSENRQHAMIDMRFNLGPSGFKSFRRMIAAVKRGDFDRAADHMHNSKWRRQVGRRSTTLINMMRRG